MKIRRGTFTDLDKLESLYNDLNDYLEAGTNYSGWIKHIYPTRETARQGINSNELFVLETDDTIAGSIILCHEPEDAYSEAQWGIDADDKDILVIRTLVVLPKFMNRSVASTLMSYAKEYAKYNNLISTRLDVSENNLAAIALYEKLGYKYVATVDLGLPYDHLKWFRLYEVIL